MTCFVFNKNGSWSRNHRKEERIATAKSSHLTKPKRAGAFLVSSPDNADNEVLELIEEIEFTSSTLPHPEDIQPSANITAALIDDTSLPEAFVHSCANNIVLYSIRGQLQSPPY